MWVVHKVNFKQIVLLLVLLVLLIVIIIIVLIVINVSCDLFISAVTAHHKRYTKAYRLCVFTVQSSVGCRCGREVNTCNEFGIWH